MAGRFVWADLSSYDVTGAEGFYSALFGWEWTDDDGTQRSGGDGGYRLAFAMDGEAAAGMYPMPEKFARMRLPSFWMPYIAVDDAAATVRIAEENGGKTEVQPEPFAKGRTALIRDPSGAGFTIYDGGDFRGRSGGFGRMAWNELFVPDERAVLPFYEKVFGWQSGKDDDGGFLLTGVDDGMPVCGVQVLPDEIRGGKKYWTAHFVVDALAESRAVIESEGGKVWDEHAPGTMFAADPWDAFFILQAGR